MLAIRGVPLDAWERVNYITCRFILPEKFLQNFLMLYKKTLDLVATGVSKVRRLEKSIPHPKRFFPPYRDAK